MSDPLFDLVFAYNQAPTEQEIAAIQSTIQMALGSAVSQDSNSAIGIECYAKSRILACMYAMKRKLFDQFNPLTMTDYLPRWESIFGIVPLMTDTLLERQERIALRFALFGRECNFANLRAILNFSIPDIFGTFIIENPLTAQASFPGGHPISGGEPCTNGPWESSQSYINVLNNVPQGWTIQKYIQEANQVWQAIDSIIPAFVIFNMVVGTQTDGGTITAIAHSMDLTGVDTQWGVSGSKTASMEAGTEISVIDDLGNTQLLSVAGVNSPTSLILSSTTTTAITNKPYAMLGFYLDGINLDIQNLDP